MPTNTIIFKVSDRDARAGFSRIRREVDALDSEFKDTRAEVERAGQAIDKLGDEARESAREVDRLGDAARQNNSVWRDTNGRLRDARDRFFGAGQGAETLTRALGGLTGVFAGLGIAVTKGVQGVSNFFDVVDEQHQALRNASELANEFAIRLSDINTATGQRDAVNARIQTLHRLTTALRIEQSQLSQSSKEYLQYAERIRAANNELDTLRAIQGRGSNNTQLRTQRTDERQRTNAEIQRYETRLARAREAAVAEDTRSVFAASDRHQHVIPNFQAALAASNAYYSERIRQAEAALEKEKEGTDAFNALQVQIFQLGHQQLTAQRQLETERTNILRTFTDERVNIERSANNAVITGFTAAARAAADAARARFAFARQIAARNNTSRADIQYGNFTSQLRQDFEDTEQQGRSLLSVMREIVRLSLESTDLDLEERIPDPGVRQQQIDDQIAAQVRAQQTLIDIRQTAAEQGSQFLNSIRQNEDRDVQRSLHQQGRQYRQFANLVSNTFINLATGRAESFARVATAFIQQSIRIALRAIVAHQLQKRLDDTLTASKIANIQKVAAAQQASGLAGVGGIPGLGNIGNIGNLLSGGGLALGASALLFPEQIRNLTGGIKDEISGFLDNVSREPVVVRANIQNNLRIGENEAREISDIQAELRQEDRV